MLRDLFKKGRVIILNVTLGKRLGVHAALVLTQLAYWQDLNDGKPFTKALYEFESHLPMGLKLIRRAIKYLCSEGVLHVQGTNKATIYWVNETKVEQLMNRFEPTKNKTTPYYLNISNNNYVSHTEQPDFDIDEALDNWVFGAESGLKKQLGLFPSSVRAKKDFRDDPVDPHNVKVLCRICYGTDTDASFNALSSTMRGRVANTLGKLTQGKADLGQLSLFESWWKKNWRSRDRQSGQYQLPRPEQVLELWWEAMTHKPSPEELKTGEEDLDINSFMSHRAKLKYNNHK